MVCNYERDRQKRMENPLAPPVKKSTGHVFIQNAFFICNAIIYILV